MVDRQRFQSENMGGRNRQKPQITLRLLILNDFPQRQRQRQFTQTAFDLNLPQAYEADIKNKRGILAERQDERRELFRLAIPPKKRMRVQKQGIQAVAISSA